MSQNNTEMCHFLQLNDDCIYEIYKLLPITAWCALRETCTRLKAISDDRFEKQFNKFELNGNYVSGSIYNELKTTDIQSLFRNFGQFFTKLVINSKLFLSDEDIKKMIPLLDRYCTDLNDLKLVRIEFDAATVIRCDRLFSNLKRLVIDKCIDNEMTLTACLANCRILKELELIRLFTVEGKSLTRHYNTLESFSIKLCANISYESVREFLVENQQLKKLKFIDCNYITDDLFQHVADNLSNLEELSVRLLNVQLTIDEHLMHLLRSTKLKKFEINCGAFVINTFLNGLATRNQMETLHLSSFEITNASVKALCSLKALKVLKFSCTVQLSGNVSKELCKKLASDLPKLSEIHIVECSNITFNEVVVFVEHSSTLQKLVFIRHDNDPSLTKDIFLSLVEARKRNSNKEALIVYLDYDDYREVTDVFSWEGNVSLFAEHIGIIKILPIEDEEDNSIKYDYGCGNRDRVVRRLYEDIEYEYKYEIDDSDYFDDDDDDDFGNDFV